MDNPLIGKILKEVKIAKDKMALLFVYEGGEMIARTDGDCCSHTWIEHVELPTAFPCIVTAVTDLEMPDLGSPDDYDVIAYYGCKISTDKGDMVIDYRNNSNGYYGGNIVFGEEKDYPEEHYFYYYGGVHGQNQSELQWTDIAA